VFSPLLIFERICREITERAMASNNRVVAVATMLFPVAAILSFVARY
jgi:hypothetical protein